MQEKRKLKVLQMCAVGFTVEKLLLPLVNEMSKYYDVTILCGRDEVTDLLKEKGYRIENVYIGRRIHPINNIRSLFQLFWFLKRERFDIVHVHTPLASLIGRVAAKLAGVPVVIYTAHGFYFHDNMDTFKRNLFILFEKIGGWLSDYIFTQSTEDYNTAIKERIIHKSKISVIGNGVDISRFDGKRLSNETDREILKSCLGINCNDLVVTIIGRVVREKGYMEWIQAANEVLLKYKNVKFMAVGDTLESDRDGIKKELDEYIAENNLEGHIIFTGSRADVPELLDITDIFTLPSYREGMPRSLIEAMCMEKPAVATDIRGCREEIDEGITGFLVPVRNSKMLAEKIEALINNPELRVKMGKMARKKAEQEFDERLVIERQIRLIEEVLREKML
ncbi:MAG: glycosyltransferase family 4 protein [Clostridia bacterium]|nr:glycosyltransferase family 4 protein [Clostridia bacterium]